MLRAILTNLKGEKFEINEIENVNFVDSLDDDYEKIELTFLDEINDEFNEIEVKRNEETIFKGVVISQETTVERDFKTTINAAGFTYILVKNDAKPQNFIRPSMNVLARVYLEDLGFDWIDENVIDNSDYNVKIGSSIFSAIDDFVYQETGFKIRSDFNKKLKKIKPSETIKGIDEYNKISLTHMINRGDLTSKINFKRYADYDYKYSADCDESKKISADKVKYLNLTSYSLDEQESIINEKFKNDLENYKTLKLKIGGWVDDGLKQMICFGHKYYFLNKKEYQLNAKEEITFLEFKSFYNDIGVNEYVRR